MGTITDEMIKAAYDVAKEVFNNKSALDKGVENLHEQYEMNRASAKHLIRNYSCLIRGEVYTRTMSGAATRYFLQKILDDLKTDALRQALKAVDLHITYYERFKHGKLNRTREIHDEFNKIAAASIVSDK
ncbi:MAG: hypothetical protein LBU76_08335 [Azoarcus sp.]|jgi:5-methylcytosine-specific restriction protein A|nr:hypothetical protein [Azoarcus sp.]